MKENIKDTFDSGKFGVNQSKKKERREGKKSNRNKLWIIATIILAITAIFSVSLQFTGWTIKDFQNQKTNEINNQPIETTTVPHYNPSIQLKENKDWQSIISDFKSQVRAVALEYDIPISQINVFTKSSGEPYRVDIQYSKYWKDDPYLRDYFRQDILQIIENLEFFQGKQNLYCDENMETKIISFYIE